MRIHPTYLIGDLVLKDQSEEEQIRTRKIFLNLKSKAVNGSFMSEHEKNFFCLLLKISRLNDGNWEDYPCCDSYKFYSTYLIYYYDLTGGSLYFKPGHKEPVQVGKAETQADLEYLYRKADEWENFVKKENHSDELSKRVSEEGRAELKTLDIQPEYQNDPYVKGTFRYTFAKRKIVLQIGFIHKIILELKELFKPDDFILSLNNEEIEITDYSLIHVLNRHFAESSKPYRTGKTYHTKDFQPRKLILQIQDIISKIDNSKLLKGKSIDMIAFCYNDIDYIIYTQMETKQVKGIGNVRYRRLNTFFPLKEERLRNKIANSYTPYVAGEGLILYVPNAL